MEINIFGNKAEMGAAAGLAVEREIIEAIGKRGEVRIILATGASQLEMLSRLVQSESIDWSRVIMYHLDEYIGISENHPASFRKYLKDRFIGRVGELKEVHLVDGENEPESECRRLNQLIGEVEIDIACVGIGENGHLAFNDPPADYETKDPFIVVELDESCRRQQLGEGWFRELNDVPVRAISMSVNQILKSRKIVVTVPDSRKAGALRDTLEGGVTNRVPASILQKHEHCFLFCDSDSASLLRKGLENQ